LPLHRQGMRRSRPCSSPSLLLRGREAMRLSVLLLLCSLAGVLGGGALIGLPALGACLIFDSLAVGGLALARDAGPGAVPSVREVGHTLQNVLARARDAA